jgi:hypothetical protein
MPKHTITAHDSVAAAEAEETNEINLLADVITIEGDLTVEGVTNLATVSASNFITPNLVLNGSQFSFQQNPYIPTVMGGPSFSVTYTNQTGYYVKIGRQVTAVFDIHFTGTITGPTITPLRITLPYVNGYPGQSGQLSTLCTLPTPIVFPISLNLRVAGFNYGALFSAQQPNTNPIMPATGANQRLVGSITYLTDA